MSEETPSSDRRSRFGLRRHAADSTDHAGDHSTRGDIVEREREEHGGIKLGACFFGWLSATGMAVLLSAVAAATGLVAGDATGTDTASEAARSLNIDVNDLGIAALVVALVLWFIAYFSGGYVAGRMARFDGLKQGLGVWLWALLIGIVVAVLGTVAGTDYEVSDGFPSVSFSDTETTTVIVVAVVVALVALVAAMLGGLAGMAFHRRVDRTGLGH